eukprot:6999732-Pyramimonas_sp.AAC.1
MISTATPELAAHPDATGNVYGKLTMRHRHRCVIDDAWMASSMPHCRPIVLNPAQSSQPYRSRVAVGLRIWRRARAAVARLRRWWDDR